MRAFIISPSTTVCADLAARCRAIRLSRNLTQQQLADMVGASLSSLRRFEAKGQASLDLFVRIAQSLGVVQQLEPLFTQQEISIAEMERQQAAQRRQRARP